MRLRNVKGAREEMLVNPYVLQNPEQYKGKFDEVFGNQNPLYVEIGTGKGQFLMELARRHPERNYIGIEKYSSVLIRAIAKEEQEELPNIRFIRMDAENILDVFGEGKAAGIYLNFSDPWPKDRHSHRRLTSTAYLARYHVILADGGVVEFKTDNQMLFDFSVEAAGDAAWEMLYVTRDLHADPTVTDNVMTEYEERFSSMGNPICKMVIRPGEKSPKASGTPSREA